MTGGLLKSNWAYIVWFIFYFTLTLIVINLFTTSIQMALILTVLLYGVSIGTALSPIGEFIIRHIEGLRPIKTEKNANYLLPIFHDTYNSALLINPRLSKNVELYISNTYDINAYAIGRNTIVVTLGAIEGLSESSLKGVLAHEFGHLSNGDTKAILLTTIGNGFFSLFIWIINLFIKLFYNVLNSRDDSSFALFFIKIVVFILNGIISIILGIGNIILALNSRLSEFLADNFAYNIGYGNELVEALYILNKIYGNEYISLKDRLKMSHPYITDRIARLENSNI